MGKQFRRTVPSNKVRIRQSDTTVFPGSKRKPVVIRKRTKSTWLLYNVEELSVNSVAEYLRRFLKVKKEDIQIKRIRHSLHERWFRLTLYNEVTSNSKRMVRFEKAIKGRMVREKKYGLRLRETTYQCNPPVMDGKDLRVMTFNSRGWMSKYEEIECLLVENKVDLFACQETWLSKQTTRASLSRYQVIESKAHGGKGKRGVLLALKRNLGFTLSEYRCTDYFVAGTISGSSKTGELIKFMAISVYIPCKGEKRKEALNMLSDLLNSLTRRKEQLTSIILLGDFNMDHSRMDRFVSKKLTAPYTRLRNTPKEVTWRGPRGKQSNLDHILTCGLEATSQARVHFKYDTSDHYPLTASIAIRQPLKQRKGMISADLIASKRGEIATDPLWRCPSDLSLTEEAQVFIDTVWEVARRHNIVVGETTKQSWRIPLSHRTRRIIDCRRQYFMKQGSSDFDESEYQRLWYDSKKAVKRDRAKKIEGDIRRKCKEVAENRFKRIWEFVAEETGRTETKTHIGPILDKASGEMKSNTEDKDKVWEKHFKDLAKDVTGHSRDQLYWKTKANGSGRHPANAVSELQELTFFKECNDEPTWGDIIAALKNMPNGKAPGLDGIVIEFLKLVLKDHSFQPRTTPTLGVIGTKTLLLKKNRKKMDVERRILSRAQRKNMIEAYRMGMNLEDPINMTENNSGEESDVSRLNTRLKKKRESFLNTARIYNGEELVPRTGFAKWLFTLVLKIWETGEIPECQEVSVTVPVPKKGDLRDPDNYRGISLLGGIVKLVAKIVAMKVANIAERRGLISKEQAGFRSREECVAQATTLYEVVRRRQLDNRKTYVCFIDFAKAYDKVPHEGLIDKIQRIGIGGRLLSMIRGLYKNPRICVRTQSGTTNAVPYLCGVRQGCPSSPILFDLYINDLLVGLEGVKVPGMRQNIRGLLFADDAVIFTPSKKKMQAALDHISKWCDRWEMSINAKKCGVMCIKPGTNNRSTVVKVKIGNEPVPTVERYVYLGILISDKLDFSSMINHNLDKGKKAYQAMRGFLMKYNIPVYFKLMAVRSVLIPILTYGSELWGFSTERTKALQKVVDSACRLIMKGGRNTCLSRLRVQLGVEELASKTAANRSRAFTKWASSLTYIADVIRERPKFRKATWVSGSERWIKRYAAEEDTSSKQRIKKVFDRRRSKADKSVYTDWAKNKAMIAKDTNLDWIGFSVKNPGLRFGAYALGQLLIGIFPTGNCLVYEAEDGRYKRKCRYCHETVMENVEHFLLQCSYWDALRKKYFNTEILPAGTLSATAGGLLGGEYFDGTILTSEYRKDPDGRILAIVNFLQDAVNSMFGRKKPDESTCNQSPLGKVDLSSR